MEAYYKFRQRYSGRTGVIPQREIKEKARELRVPVSTIERDYAQNWILKNLSSMDIALKGGTGIRKAYIENYRFSDDLDFTLLSDIKREEIEERIMESVRKSGEESGIFFSNDLAIKENKNGFEMNVYFRITQREANLTRIKIDLTKETSEKILLPLNILSIIHPYAEDFSSSVKVYALEEIMAEKIRSLFQRTRPRDLYDVWFLWDKVNMINVKKILPDKFLIEKVEPVVDEVISRKNDFEYAWRNSLQHQLGDLPDFEGIFENVVGKIKVIKVFDK